MMMRGSLRANLWRDRPARGRTIGSGAPFAVQKASEHDKAGQAFLAARAQDITEAGKQGRFDQLVVAAPPSALGILRKKLPADATAKLIGVYDKDLTNEDEHNLQEYFLGTLEHW